MNKEEAIRRINSDELQCPDCKSDIIDADKFPKLICRTCGHEWRESQTDAEVLTELNAEETLHLLEHVIGLEAVKKAVRLTREEQGQLEAAALVKSTAGREICWTCASIARKLGIEE